MLTVRLPSRTKLPREYEACMARIRAAITREARPFEDMSSEAIAARKALPFAERARVYFPHWLGKPDAPFHAEADRRRLLGGTLMVDCWSRNSGKSTRYMIVGTALDVVEQRFHSIVFGAKTEDAAIEKAELVRAELRFNARLRCDFGDDIEPRFGADKEADWTACGCRVQCIGTGQALRGALSPGTRPQVFRGDDLDDTLINRSRDRQQKLWDWLRDDVQPALADPAGTSIMHVLCNMYNRSCLAERARELAEDAQFADNPLCLFHRHPLLGDDGESTWPARFSTQKVKRMLAQAGPSSARTQYLCLAANDEAAYLPDWFRDFRLDLAPPAEIAAMRKLCFLDPSFEAKESSDFKSLITIGRLPRHEEIYTLDAWLRRVPPEPVVEHMYELLDRYPDVTFWGEANSGARDTYRLTAEKVAARLGRPRIWINWVTHTANKDGRLMAPQGLISQGLLYVDRSQGDQQRLVNQWCDIPRGRNDDGPDAQAAAIVALGPASLDGPLAVRHVPREDRGALVGLGAERRREPPPLPGSPDERFERFGEDAFGRLAREHRGIVF